MSENSDSNTPQITQDDLEWAFGETVADDIQQMADQLTVHARGFVLETDVWFDEYAVMMGHKYAWNTKISKHYDEDSWVDVSDNCLYFSLGGTGSFILQHPIGHNITQKHLETLLAFCNLVEFEDDYILKLRHEDYDTYTNSDAVTRISVKELEEYISGENDVLDDIIGDRTKQHGMKYKERIERSRQKRKKMENLDPDERPESETNNDDSSTDPEPTKQRRFDRVSVEDAWCEENDDGLFIIYFEPGRDVDIIETDDQIKLGEFATERQAEQAANSMTGFHLKKDEVEKIHEYNIEDRE